MTEGISHEHSAMPDLEQRERLFERIERRHEAAVSAARLEEYVSSVIDGKLSWPDLESRMQRLGGETQGRFLSVAERYVDRFRAAMKAIDSLKEQWKISKYEHDPDSRFGERLFQERVGRKPGGDPWRGMDTEVREGYVVMKFGDRKDLLSFIQGRDVADASEMTTLGQFHRAMSFPFGRMDVPFLVAYSGEEMSSALSASYPSVAESTGSADRTRRTVVHERQHFINHAILGRFEDEKLPPLGETEAERLDLLMQHEYHKGLKDEFLAFFRDGRSALDMPDFLNEKNYPQLFKPPRAKELLEQTLRQLRELEPYIPTSRAREIIVYHLVDVPLTKIPERLENLLLFFRERCKFDRREDDAITPDVPIGAIFSPKRQEQADLAAEAGEAFAFESAIGGTKISKRAREFRNAFAKAAEAVHRDGTLVPYARIVKTEWRGKGRQISPESYRRNAERLVEALEGMPQSVIDAMLRDFEIAKLSDDRFGQDETVRPVESVIHRALRSLKIFDAADVWVVRVDQEKNEFIVGCRVKQVQSGSVFKQQIELTLSGSPRRHELEQRRAQGYFKVQNAEAGRHPVLPKDFKVPELDQTEYGSIKERTVEFPLRIGSRDFVGKIKFLGSSDRLGINFEAYPPGDEYSRAFMYEAAYIGNEPFTKVYAVDGNQRSWFIYTHRVDDPQGGELMHAVALRGLEEAIVRAGTQYPEYMGRWIQIIPESSAEATRLIDPNWLGDWVASHPGAHQEVNKRSTEKARNFGYVPSPANEVTIVNAIARAEQSPRERDLSGEELSLIKPLDPTLQIRKSSYR